MIDFLKQPLSQGDRVVHGKGGRYGGLSGPYFIHSFTPKMVRISRCRETTATECTTVPPSNLVKVPEV